MWHFLFRSFRLNQCSYPQDTFSVFTENSWVVLCHQDNFRVAGKSCQEWTILSETQPNAKGLIVFSHLLPTRVSKDTVPDVVCRCLARTGTHWRLCEMDPLSSPQKARERPGLFRCWLAQTQNRRLCCHTVLPRAHAERQLMERRERTQEACCLLNSVLSNTSSC